MARGTSLGAMVHSTTLGMLVKNAEYTFLLLEAYEDEIAGAAYFDGLAAAYPQHSAFLEKCAALERATASQLNALIRKYQMIPQSQQTLEVRGATYARKDSAGEWQALMQRSIDSYPRYVTEFKALEAIGPPEDQPILAALTEHELQLIEWMRAETTS